MTKGFALVELTVVIATIAILCLSVNEKALAV
ncbi:MAG: prepilin-type N-terminal cleavage/methylation domain-containing protein [Candidatus Omnitrophota bacterium]